MCWACLAHQYVTHQEIRERGDLEYAEEHDITNYDNEYAIGNNSNMEPLAEGDEDNDDEYIEDGGIAGNNNEYTVGNDGVDKPLAKGDDEYDTLSAARARACPESQHASVPSC